MIAVKDCSSPFESWRRSSPGHRGGRSRTDGRRLCHKRHEAELRAAVTFSKRVKSIEFPEEMRRAGSEVGRGSTLQIALCLQPSEDALQFATMFSG